MPEVLLSERARRELLRLARPYLAAVEAGIDRLAQDPLEGKGLRGDLGGLRSLRIGSYRIVYAFDARRGRVEIVWIRHRREAYR
ncbi:MAG TPA: type II toxin-antitoxin system RelE/ParE family toxin [Candidatus Limnocylindria bacterium]|nr:type II toxin-antitoxin system RelE/ParE family toxin [Candidatus Limnocylindria bacterium]